MKLRPIGEWISGFMLVYLLSPIAPPARWLLLSWNWLPYSPDLQTFNLPVLVALGVVSLGVPPCLYFVSRRKAHHFAWGLLIAYLMINIPSYALAVLIPFAANF